MKITLAEKIVVIGNGNLASCLVEILIKKKSAPIKFIGHSTAKSKTFSAKYKIPFSLNVKDIPTETTIIFLCIPYDKIESVAKSLKNSNALLVHCSGSTSLEILKKHTKNYGVFYPLQTFSSEVHTEFKKTPILIEGNSVATERKLIGLAKLISENVIRINSAERLKIHLAAVISSNFTNHLYYLTEHYLKKNTKVSFDLLKPLIKQTVKKIKHVNPEKSQTGPAIRGDKKIINKHLAMLSNDKNLQHIYKILSNSITRSK